jgi:hypothetical protein
VKLNDSAGNKKARKRRRRRVLISSALPALIIAIAIPGRAQTKTALPKNEDCFMCHNDPGLKNGKGLSIYVDKDAFEKSIHAKAGKTCIRCHADFLSAPELPHISDLEPVSCKTCHAGMTAGVSGPAAHTIRKEPRTFAARFIKMFYTGLIALLMAAFLVFIASDLHRRRRNT